MLATTNSLLRMAEGGQFAVGAFNVYNLEGAMAIVAAAEQENSPAMLQLHPGSLGHGGAALVALCIAAVEGATVPMSVHLDHSSSRSDIERAFRIGIKSVMADGSALDYEHNVAFTRDVVQTAHYSDAFVEAELGRLTGTEDGLTVPEYEALLTDPDQAGDFAERTRIDALAVCIGNVHGSYSGYPSLDFERLEKIRDNSSVPLVLHGASGLPDHMVRRSIQLGVRKLNVNTEVRSAYVDSLATSLQGTSWPELTDLMGAAVDSMKEVVVQKLRLFGSSTNVE